MPDNMQRYKYPIALHNPIQDTAGMFVLSPNIGLVMLKGGPADREHAPEHVTHFQRMWAVSQTNASGITLQQTCHFCSGCTIDADRLFSCALCMLTTHNACALQRSTSVQFSLSKDELLPKELFGNRHVCAICLACFM